MLTTMRFFWCAAFLSATAFAAELYVSPSGNDKNSGSKDAPFATITRALLAELPEREAKVIAGIYGINQESPQTLREVGESMGISHERVRQLRDQALRRIRKLHTIDSIREKTGGLLGMSRPENVPTGNI